MGADFPVAGSGGASSPMKSGGTHEDAYQLLVNALPENWLR